MLNTNLNLPTFLPPILTVDVFTLGNRLLAQTEILNLLNRLRNKNHFHYLIIKFLVCTGLSLPELIHLKIADFNKEMDRFYITNVGRLRKRHIFLDPKFAVELYRYSCEFSSRRLSVPRPGWRVTHPHHPKDFEDRKPHDLTRNTHTFFCEM